MFPHLLSIDEDAVLAAPVNYSGFAILGRDNSMPSADVLKIELNVIVRSATNGQSFLEKGES